MSIKELFKNKKQNKTKEFKPVSANILLYIKLTKDYSIIK